ncbi:glycoside hydrolase family 3 protein [Mycolicibacterium mengxianglii]|uniref:glycoside hydrolase family 3 protein n=1 Tax=Mycolicibacterium mengxianglii TaxID=2736649 RepID=UPI0018EEE713|nr:glycoside hydrolase family 3 N-terminal domain-containing protein [Mycolicibacterium mengxianglii]
MSDIHPPERRADELLARLALPEKVGLMFHTMAGIGELGAMMEKFGAPTVKKLIDKGISHFNLLGPVLDAREHAQWYNDIQRFALERPSAMPVTFSTDPRHHFADNPAAQAMAGAFSQWPEPLGLAAIGSVERVQEFADIVRQEYLAVGIRVALHPQLDLATEPRWSRINATFGEDAELTSRLGVGYVRGLQGTRIDAGSVAAMVKHFPGGGPQLEGKDPHFPWGREQVYPGHNRDYHLLPFRAAIAAGAAEVMPYYGMPIGTDWEEVGFGFNRSVVTTLLRQELGFDGVVCTDWGLITEHPELGDLGVARAWGVEELSREDRVLRVVDAGADQFGGEDCAEVLLELVRSGRITEARIDESARRLLRVKFALGLFDNPFVDEERAAALVGRDDFAAAGRQAQKDSVTLLVNGTGGTAVLPLRRGLRLYAPEVSDAAVALFGTPVEEPAHADIALLRLKAPFEPADGMLAQFFHHGSLEFDEAEIARVREISALIPTVVDVYLDRPAVLTPLLGSVAALVVDYGITETALLEVLFGVGEPRGALPFDLPVSDAAVAASRTDVAFDTEAPVFGFGHGLRY